MSTIKQRFWWCIGWMFIRPIRWLFFRMVRATSLDMRIRRELAWDYRKDRAVMQWRLPNLHWWLLYKTVFRFFKWLHWDAWRVFCKVRPSSNFYAHIPWYARVIRWIGRQTAGYAISGGRCYHCGREAGCPGRLSEDDNTPWFVLTASGTTGTPDGTDHWFKGIATCPCCGYQSEYGDSSL